MFNLNLPCLKTVPSCPVWFLGREPDPQLAPTSFQGTVQWEDLSGESSRVNTPAPSTSPHRTSAPDIPPALWCVWSRCPTMSYSPSVDSFQHFSVLPELRGSEQHLRCRLTNAEYRGSITSLGLLPCYSWSRPGCLLGCRPALPGPFPRGCLPAAFPQLVLLLVWPKCSTLPLALLSLTQLTLAHRSSLSRPQAGSPTASVPHELGLTLLIHSHTAAHVLLHF